MALVVNHAGTMTSWFERLLAEVWNEENHASLLEMVDERFAVDDAVVRTRRRGPLLLLDLINVYKMFVPDFRIRLEHVLSTASEPRIAWRAEGHHVGFGAGVAPTGRHVELEGILVAHRTVNRARCVRGAMDVCRFAKRVGIDMWTMNRLLRHQDGRVMVRAIGRRGGNTVLLFPTLTLPGWLTWRRAMRTLERTAPVATFQLIGNRRAFEHLGVDARYGVDVEIRAARLALSRAGLRPPFDIVAHSAGATLALEFASRHPSMVRTLTLIEPGASWVLAAAGVTTAVLDAAVARRRRAYEVRVTPSSYARFIQQTLVGDDADITRSRHWPVLRAYRDNVPFRAPLLAHAGSLKRLRRARYPVLLIRGAQSDELHHRIVDVLSTTFPNARVVELPGGHAPHVGEATETFVAVLRRFLRSVSPSAPRHQR